MIDIVFKILGIIFPAFIKKMRGVTLDIWKYDHQIHIKNTSSSTAYNFDVQPSEDLFWTFGYSTPETLLPGRELRIQFSRVTSNKKSGTLRCFWTNKKGNKKSEYSYPIDF